jgi:cell division protein FtsL
MKILYVLLLYFFVGTIPFFLELVAQQSIQYAELEAATKEAEEEQLEWIENNKRLIMGITHLSTAERIERKAKEMGLSKIQPENVIQIRIRD